MTPRRRRRLRTRGLRGAETPAETLFREGMEAYLRRDYAGAIAGLRASLRVDPEASAPRFFPGASETRARLWAVMAMLAAAALRAIKVSSRRLRWRDEAEMKYRQRCGKRKLLH